MIHNCTDCRLRLPYIYWCIRPKIYDKILPEKFGVTYHRIVFFPATNIHSFRRKVVAIAKSTGLRRRCRWRIRWQRHLQWQCRDYADLLHPVQVLKKPLRLIHGSMILDYVWTWICGGNLCANIYRSRYSVWLRGSWVVRCRTCDRKVVGSNPAHVCCVPMPTQHVIPPGSVNEYQRKLGSKRAYLPCDALALYPWSCGFGWCLAEG